METEFSREKNLPLCSTHVKTNYSRSYLISWILTFHHIGCACKKIKTCESMKTKLLQKIRIESYGWIRYIYPIIIACIIYGKNEIQPLDFTLRSIILDLYVRVKEIYNVKFWTPLFYINSLNKTRALLLQIHHGLLIQDGLAS